MNLGRALRHRNYRLFFAGQGLSLVGTWLTRFAMGFATWEASHSPFLLGLVAFFSQAPTSIIAPVAGVLVDRWDRHRTIVVTQIAAALQSAALAAFALTGTQTVWSLMVLGAVQAVINAFDMPARQSFVRQMVDDRADLPNAIALNSSLVNGARLLGPALAAVLCDAVGVGWCFALDALSYVAVIASLLMMRVIKQAPRVRSGKRVSEEMREGLAYLKTVPLVRGIIIMLAVMSMLGGAYSAMLPAIAGGTMDGGPHALGWLMGAAGAGALVGTLFLASRSHTRGLPRLIANCGLGVGVMLIALEAAPTIFVAVPILFFLGMSLMVLWASTNTLVQTLVDEDKLGRVMSLYAVAFFSGAPIGALLEGGLATLIGPIHTFAVAGVGCLLCAWIFRLKLPQLSKD